MSGAKGKSDMKPIESFPNGATIERHSLYGYIVRLNGRLISFSRKIKTVRDMARVAHEIPSIRRACEVDSCGWNDPTWRDGV